MSNPKIKFIVTPPPDATVENSDASYTDTVVSGGLLILPDQTIEVNTVNEGSIPSVGTIEIDITDGVNPVTPNDVTIVGRKVTVEVPSGGGSPSGVLLQFPKPSQYTSFRTGDEGWRAQNGWFDYVPPAQPAAIAELDYTSANQWYLLKNDLIVNGVASKRRFVDLNGVQTWGATNNVNAAAIDKLTGLMFTRLVGGAQWDPSIDNALTYSVVINGVTYDDWFCISFAEAVALFGTFMTSSTWVDANTSATLYPSTSSLYTATTHPNATTQAMLLGGLGASGCIYTPFGKTSGGGGIRIYVRKAFNLITAP
jgi:hypothetical protein